MGKITGLCKTQEPEFRPHHPCKKARHGHVLLEPPCHVGQRQEDCLTGRKASSRISERLFPRNRAGSDKAGHLADSSGFCTYMYAHITLTYRHIHAHTLTQRCTKKFTGGKEGGEGRRKEEGIKPEEEPERSSCSLYTQSSQVRKQCDQTWHPHFQEIPFLLVTVTKSCHVI